MGFEYPVFFPPDKNEGRNLYLNGSTSKVRFPMFNLLSSDAEVDDEGYTRGL
jgi:hypothetical protein